MRHSYSIAIVALLAAGCGHGNDSATSPAPSSTTDVSEVPDVPGAPPTALLPATPPPALAEHAKCLVSADCPSGAHCDLGECVQDCNADAPCGAALSCSQRARCVKNEAEDIDPVPLTKPRGVFTATCPVKTLSETDTELAITLQSSSKGPVAYRVEVDGPHLSIDQPRGQFTGTSTLRVKVNGAAFSNRDIPGMVRIFTELGDSTVTANLHAGMSGMYRGVLSYGSDHVALGDARIRLALSETSGGVLAWIDPSASLLFPEDASARMVATTGSGTVTDGTLTLTVSQRIPGSFGGARNHLGRDIGRQLTFRMKPTAGGWKGDFDERITGLFAQPVTTKGTVALLYENREGMTPIALSNTPSAVTLPSSAMTRSLPGWAGGDCVATLRSSNLCPTVDWPNANATDRSICLANQLYSTHVLPLFDAMQGSVTYAELAEQCGQGVNATNLESVSPLATTHCGNLPLIECGVQLAAQSDVSVPGLGLALNRLVNGAIQPPMLVAQERLMHALDASIGEQANFTLERDNYDQAASALQRAVTWVYQPAVLEGLRRLDPTVAAGIATDKAPPYVDYPAARAISKLLRTLRDVEAERTRLNAVEHLDSLLDRRGAAQSSGLSAYLEGVALNVLFSTWGNAPETVGAESTRLLGPFDAAFGAALDGAGIFGLPETFVPFVFDPKEAGKNNFVQMLAIADAQIALYTKLETAYDHTSHAARASDYALADAAQNLTTQYDARIKQLCGATFDIPYATTTRNVSSCGENSGQVATLHTQLVGSGLGLEGAIGQLKGMQDKIGIDLRVMADKFQLHQDNLRFIDDQGNQLDALAWSEGVVNAEQALIATSSQGTLGNGFASVALAIPMFLLEMQKTALQVARQDVQTAQQMHFERQAANAEQMDAQAAIQKQNIDLAQYRLHIEQSRLDQTVANCNLSNSLAEVQLLLDERAQAARVSKLNPASDPSFRLLRDDAAIKMLGARSRAQKYLFLAGRALEYELNQPVPDLVKAVLMARSANRMETLGGCLGSTTKLLPATQLYWSTLSVRKMLGITGPRKDSCTGETLSAAQQFQRRLLQNENLDGQGGVTIKFATDLMPDNGLWSTDVCGDRIATIRGQLVGDFLGNDEAQLNLSLTGAAILRECKTGDVVSWSLGGDAIEGLGSSTAVIQAGVNDFGKAPANSSLFGQSVARAEWVLTIPGSAAAPSNSDVDLSKLEDIVLEVAHEARPANGSASLGPDLSCLEQVM